MIELRAETKADYGSLSAPGTIEGTQTKAASAAAAAAAAVRNLPPPGAATPTRPRGQPWEPLSPFLSPITGRWFTIDAAPNRPKRFRSDSYDDDDSLNEDEEGTPAPKRLKWNIHDRFAFRHVRSKFLANARANLEHTLLLEEEMREAERREAIMVDAERREADAREAEIREADVGEDVYLEAQEHEIIDLVTPTTTPTNASSSSSSGVHFNAEEGEIIDLVSTTAATTTTSTPEIIDLVSPNPSTITTSMPEIIDLVTPTISSSESSIDRP